MEFVLNLDDPRVYINPLGVAFEDKSISQENIKFPPLRVVREKERYSYNSCIFFSVFYIISPLLPMEVGLLPNHVKFDVLVFMVIGLYCLLGNSFYVLLPSLSLGVSLLLCWHFHNRKNMI